MNLSWGDISKTVSSILPTLGTALGGPLGGIAGTVIASTLGVEPTPDAVSAAIKADPSAAFAKLKDTEAEWARTEAEQARTDAAQSTAINTTMQAEIAAGVSWWHWRHLLGYVFMAWCVMPMPFAAIAFARGDSAGLKNLFDFASAFWPYFVTIAGVLGYIARDTSRRQAAAITGTPITGITDVLLSLLKRGK